MAKGDVVVSGEMVVRYARPEDYEEGILSGSAFYRPAKDADGLSVTRRGYFYATDDVADMREIRAIMVSRAFPLGDDSCFAELSVEDIIAAGREAQTIFSVVEAPSKSKDKEGKLANPAHAIIDGLPLEGTSIGSFSSQLVGDLLVSKVRREHPGWI